ncbi:ATP-binding protein [Desulfococcaceae bacterium HSG7]|nr:ATP-binding protein [Desulfococcaceae bacterium HSG7]
MVNKRKAESPAIDQPLSKNDDARTEMDTMRDQLCHAQTELIRLEKMAALGYQVASVAHEINTPLGAIRSSVQNIDEFLKLNVFQLPDFYQSLEPPRQHDFLALLRYTGHPDELIDTRTKRKIRRELRHLLENEDIADAETIADALADIGLGDQIDSFWPLLKSPQCQAIINKVYQLAMLQRSFQTISTATEQAAKVASALISYARHNADEKKEAAHIIESIETILILYHNQLKHGVEIIRKYDDVPLIDCYPDQLNQVWRNLIHNALQAMKNKGQLEISVSTDERLENVIVCITDNGPGMAPDILPHIFDPFFTTKPDGEGSGLGLDIVKKIITKHNGTILAKSIPGRTAFTVTLPI